MVGIRIIALNTSSISTITAASGVVSSGGRTLLIVNALLVSFCNRDPFNGDFEILS